MTNQNDTINKTLLWDLEGKDITAALDADAVEQAMKDAGWDFHVKMGQVKCVVDRNEVHPGTYLDTDVEAPNQFLLFRDDNNMILSNRTTVTESYYVYQNSEFMTAMREVAARTGMKITKAGVTNGGRRCWMVAEFPGFGRVDINTGKYRGDYLNPVLYVSLTHDGQSTIRFQLIARRKCCSNVFTGIMSKIVRQMDNEINEEEGYNKKIRHTKSVVLKVDEAVESVEKMLARYNTIMDKFRRMANVAIKGEQLNQTVRKILGVDLKKPFNELHTKTKNRIEDFMRMFNRPGLGTYGETLWDLMNAVTATNTHTRKVKKGNSRLDNLIYGTGANFEKKAFAMLDQMVLEAEKKAQEAQNN